MRGRPGFEVARRWGHLVGPLLGLVVLLGLFPFLLGLVPVARFVRERIDIAVYPGEVRVVGRYVYRNPWPFPVVQGLSIPLPTDESHPVPTELTATREIPSDGPIPLRKILGRIGFELPLGPHEEAQVIVRYRQDAPAGDARYLLTTTRPWGRPLEQAVYAMTLHDVRLVRSNYPLRADGSGILGFERTDFMPPEDWQFQWEVPQR